MALRSAHSRMKRTSTTETSQAKPKMASARMRPPCYRVASCELRVAKAAAVRNSQLATRNSLIACAVVHDSGPGHRRFRLQPRHHLADARVARRHQSRSEERRVGKECKSQWFRCQ